MPLFLHTCPGLAISCLRSRGSSPRTYVFQFLWHQLYRFVTYFVLTDFLPCLVNPPSSCGFKNILFSFLPMTMNQKPGVLSSTPNTAFPAQTALSGQTAQETSHWVPVAAKHFRHGWAGLRCATWWVPLGVNVRVQSCLTQYHPIDCSTPGSSVHGILQTRIPEWVAIAFSTWYE